MMLERQSGRESHKFPFVEAIRFYGEQLILIDCSSLVLEVICFVRFDEAVRFLIFINTFGNWELSLASGFALC